VQKVSNGDTHNGKIVQRKVGEEMRRIREG
jgi:hypothetical protein